jgi:hypothetical protein
MGASIVQTRKRPPRYQSYVLRCWAERLPAWRFSLEDPNTGRRCGFADLEALLAFLQAELASGGPRPAGVGPVGDEFVPRPPARRPGLADEG